MPDTRVLIELGVAIITFVGGMLHLGNRIGQLEAKIDLLVQVCPRLHYDNDAC